MPQHTYADFDLLVEPGDDDGYRARVLNSPVGRPGRCGPVRGPAAAAGAPDGVAVNAPAWSNR